MTTVSRTPKFSFTKPSLKQVVQLGGKCKSARSPDWHATTKEPLLQRCQLPSLSASRCSDCSVRSFLGQHGPSFGFAEATGDP